MSINGMMTIRERRFGMGDGIFNQWRIWQNSFNRKERKERREQKRERSRFGLHFIGPG
jgi:hypothetical protein